MQWRGDGGDLAFLDASRRGRAYPGLSEWPESGSVGMLAAVARRLTISATDRSDGSCRSAVRYLAHQRRRPLGEGSTITAPCRGHPPHRRTTRAPQSTAKTPTAGCAQRDARRPRAAGDRPDRVRGRQQDARRDQVAAAAFPHRQRPQPAARTPPKRPTTERSGPRAPRSDGSCVLDCRSTAAVRTATKSRSRSTTDPASTPTTPSRSSPSP